MSQPVVRQATPDDLKTINGLLESAALPTSGVADHLRNFLVAEDEGSIIGAIGLEVYGETGLLRSAVVAPRMQGNGIGSLLYTDNLKQARRLGIRRLILLTNTNEQFFAEKGFRKIDQKAVSGPVTTSVEFSGVCPAHAACMELIL